MNHHYKETYLSVFVLLCSLNNILHCSISPYTSCWLLEWTWSKSE